MHFNLRLKKYSRSNKNVIQISHLKYKSSPHYGFMNYPCVCTEYLVPLSPVTVKLFV